MHLPDGFEASVSPSVDRAVAIEPHRTDACSWRSAADGAAGENGVVSEPLFPLRLSMKTRTVCSASRSIPISPRTATWYVFATVRNDESQILRFVDRALADRRDRAAGACGGHLPTRGEFHSGGG